MARADEKSWRHGIALFGDFKYPAGFKQFDYVNVSAPKGGTVRQTALGTYDNFNIVVDGVRWTKPRRVIAKVFQEILRLIAELRPQPPPVPA